MTQDALQRANTLVKKIDELEKSAEKIEMYTTTSVSVAFNGGWLNLTEDMANDLKTYLTESYADTLADLRTELEEL